MKFIILEEDEKLIDIERNVISKVLFAYDIDYEIDVYRSVNSKLKKEIENNNTLKTFILSVDINQSISGIDVGEYIRKYDYYSNIIFITNHGNMFELVHRKIFNVFEFIEKYQNMEKRLERDIKKIVKCYLDDNLLEYEYKSSVYRIHYRYIKYINRDTLNRKLNIVANNKVFECNKSIVDMLDMLDKRFIRVSKSVIINQDYIEEINMSKGYIKLIDDTVIDSVSKKYCA